MTYWCGPVFPPGLICMTGIFMSNVQIFNTGSVSTTFVDLKYSKCESNVNDKERQNMQPFEAIVSVEPWRETALGCDVISVWPNR